MDGRLIKKVFRMFSNLPGDIKQKHVNKKTCIAEKQIKPDFVIEKGSTHVVAY